MCLNPEFLYIFNWYSLLKGSTGPTQKVFLLNVPYQFIFLCH
jgi:hypothetical protein